MEELLIEEKKYVSSKQAAKLTGYAKDYIGQLCREGRVPARLVGRSWYVLESAIQDHRFGPQVVEQKNSTSQETAPTAWDPRQTWESPRYESSPRIELLPSLNRLEKKAEPLQMSPVSPLEDELLLPEIVAPVVAEPPKQLETRVEHTADNFPMIGTQMLSSTSTAVTSEGSEEEKEGLETQEDTVVSVPLHIVGKIREREEERAPRGLQERGEPRSRTIHMRLSKVTRGVQAVSILLAAVFLGLALTGAGYFDKYVISVKQVAIISGAVVYIK